MTTETTTQEIDNSVNNAIDSADGNSAKYLQYATDATRLLSTNADTLTKVANSGFFERIKEILPNKKDSALQANVDELKEMQSVSWRMLDSLNQRNLLTADTLITVKNNLNSLAIDKEDMKKAVTTMAIKVNERFIKLENRVSTVEASQNLETWINNLKFDNYDQLPEAIRFLKVIKGFYLNKQDNYTSNELKSLKRALDNVGFDFKERISLSKLIDNIIEELQSFDESVYIDITKIEMPKMRKFQMEKKLHICFLFQVL